MTRSKSAFRLASCAALLMTAVACPARAEFSFIAQSTCDSKAGTLRIEQVWTEEPDTYQAQAGSEIMRLDDLVKYVTKSGDDYRVKVRDWQLVCMLDRARYEISVSPWNLNDHVAGMCGGGSPNVQLTVRREGHVLVNGLIFSGYCDDPKEKLIIYSVTFSEGRAAATFIADNGELRKPIPLEHGYPDLGTLTRAKLWQDLVMKLSDSNSGQHP